MNITPLPAHRVVDLSEIRPHPDNPRKISQKAVDRVARSLKRFGWKQPMVVDVDGFLVVGHTRLLAAQKLGLDEGPVVDATDLTPAELAAYRIEDNRSGEFSEWDLEGLAGQVEELERLDRSLVDLLDPESWQELLDFEVAMLGDQAKDDRDREIHEYSKTVRAPVYEPVGDEPPAVADLFDTSKADRLRDRISSTPGLPTDLRDYLLAAAGRHVVFDYRKAAEYYPHADPAVQRLFEESALVIVDFGDAIQHGFTRFQVSVEELRAEDVDVEAAP